MLHVVQLSWIIEQVVVKYPAKKARNVEGDRVGAYGVERGLKVKMSGRNQNQNN